LCIPILCISRFFKNNDNSEKVKMIRTQFFRKISLKRLVFAALLTGVVSSAWSAVQGPYLPPEGKRLLIIGQDFQSNRDYDAYVGPVPAGVMSYMSITDLTGLTTDLGSGVELNNAGLLFQTYPNSVLQLAVHMVGSLGAINNGQYDGNIDTLIGTLKAWQRPIFLRWGYEFDGPWNSYDPTQFKAAWIRVHNKVKAAGANNIIMVWHSSSACKDATTQDTFNGSPMGDWWPGAQYVDWIGLSYFQPEQCANLALNTVVNFARAQNKPLMIGEATVRGRNLNSLTYSNTWNRNDNISTTANAIWSGWFAPFFSFINNNADVIKAVSYINANWDVQNMWNAPYENGYWGDTRVQVNSTILANWKAEVGKSAWMHASPTLFSDLGTTTNTPRSAYKVVNIPGRIQAEDYDNGGLGTAFNDTTSGNSGTAYRSDAVDLQATSDTGGGYNVGWTVNGEWLEYSLANIASGTYNISVRVAALAAGGSVQVVLGGTALGTATVNATGGWQSWATVTINNVAITAGSNKILRLNIGGGNVNVNWVEFVATTVGPTSVKMEAESGTTKGSASVYNDAPASGGKGMAYISTNGAGFTLRNVLASTSFELRYASAQTGNISYYVNGVKGGNIGFSSTGNWITTYASVNVTKTIPVGATVDIVFESGNAALNVDYITFKK
jgi:hypothetical protein